MNDILVDELPPSQRAAEAGLEAMSASYREGFKASLGEDVVRSPSPSGYRSWDRDAGQYRERDLGQGRILPPRTAAPILSADDANAQYGIEGHLKFEADTPEPIARELRALKVEEIERQDTMRRAKVGIGTKLLTGLIAAVMDPLNVASAFVPAVGPARFANMAARMGTPTARVTAGAAEGLVGAALVEPITYLVAKQEQADYTAVDSLLNLTFGTVLGGGLHLAAGAVRDRITGLPAAVDALPVGQREDLLRGAIAAVAEGRAVDVADFLKMRLAQDGLFMKGTAAEARVAERVATGQTQTDIQAPADIVDFIVGKGGLTDPTFESKVATEAGRMAARRAGSDVYQFREYQESGLIRVKDGMDLDRALEQAVEAGYLKEGATLNDLLAAVSDTLDARKGNDRVQRNFSQKDGAEADAFLEQQRLKAADDEFIARYGAGEEGRARWDAERMVKAGLLDASVKDLPVEDLRYAIDERLGAMEVDNVEQALDLAANDFRETARADMMAKVDSFDPLALDPVIQREADAAAARVASEPKNPEMADLMRAAEADIAHYERMIRSATEQGGEARAAMLGEEGRALNEVGELIAEADDFGKAWEAAAACRLGH